MCLTPQDEIDGVAVEFFQFLSFKAGESPRWDRLPSLFLPTAVLIENKYGEPTTLSLAQYIEHLRKKVEEEHPTFLHIRELASETKYKGTVAQRFVEYESKLGTSIEQKWHGSMSFQLIKFPGQWLIASIVWTEEKNK